MTQQTTEGGEFPLQLGVVEPAFVKVIGLGCVEKLLIEVEEDRTEVRF